VRPRGARDGKRRDAESGVSAVEFVMLTPLAFLMIFLTVQFALYMYSRHVAIAASQEGARVARTEAATNTNWQTDATDEADHWVTQLAPSLSSLGSQAAKEKVDGVDNVSVTVTVSVPSLFPWWSGSLSVTEMSEGPIEQFIPDN
jgi:Flp pilus assembly protein TadG